MGPADECSVNLHAASLDNAEQQQDGRQRQRIGDLRVIMVFPRSKYAGYVFMAESSSMRTPWAYQREMVIVRKATIFKN